MDETIAYCGLICTNCPIHLAGKELNKIKRERMIDGIIIACKEYYGIKYNWEDINPCDGCKSKSGNLFFGCRNCLIRECAEIKKIASCAYCNEYPCENLLSILKIEPGAKDRLDSLRRQSFNS